ncbi:tripartite tricarboxylate transporter substrate binding protein [Mobilicoccus caccae]|uniref:Tricarboxylic transport membrane protein n=1 Tax=Mobilicoccus caccae TaxID=1859295 RepID=A0ABQ6J0K4_9MICO|nr:tripartite tricarboxylate transporter substrate-binding protein [Mobilicoccus caccae]GMA37982.1 tricarboxylic transport membrane protein [Mobilicoccus caccae]GMA42365.1 tricarboxylic transport membrane protein [Mobilicoccus caccae]GMA42513.1 tricarboxylic transport membrane protein [Mobilicoccus caccae]
MSTPVPQRDRRTPRLGMAIYAVVCVVVVGLAVLVSARAAHSGEDLRANLTLIAPAGAGGGWDTFAREQQAAMRTENVVNNAQVVNIPGAGGTIGLSKFVTMTGEATNLMVTGTVMIGAIETNDSPNTLKDVRPIARISEEYDVIVVPADSPHQSIDDLVAAWKQDPKGMVFTGGSAGGLDHLIVADLALKAGIDAEQITYIPKSGGGEAVQVLSSGAADAAVSGYNEFADQIDAGRMRGLAIVAPERADGIELPTLVEQGYDVAMTNWRGFVAPPGISDEQFSELQQIITETAQTQEWKDAMARNKWTDVLLTGPELDTFIEEDTAQITALVKELGL